MNYNEALNIILNKQSLGIMPGLARISKLLDEMGNPQNALKIIHIAGTNGKGTVAYTIANTLADNGYKTGLFTSPWIYSYREQIQINGAYISKEDLAYYIEKYQHNDCTEFEMLTAIMYKCFADNKVDYAVVECGMGGLNDSTNTEKENLAVITSIALDHTNFLGDTIEKIALEKAGIIKENCTCILYPNPQVEHIFEQVCKERNAKLVKVLCDSDASFSAKNLQTAAAAVYALGLDANVTLCTPDARQTSTADGKILIDGGHNVDAAQALAGLLNDNVALIGMMKDKNVDGYLSIVAPHCKKIIATTVDNPRAMSALELKRIASKYCSDVVSIDAPAEALSYAKKSGLDLICGSFYLIREIIKELD
ncbi:MAG: Mur ligase family protein [Clostridium sp.]|nr:Mur ligase family protein [Clostridium sp.]